MLPCQAFACKQVLRRLDTGASCRQILIKRTRNHCVTGRPPIPECLYANPNKLNFSRKRSDLILPFKFVFGMGKKAAGRQVLCTHRRVTPALGARLLRSYVPLRYGPSESGCDNNTCLPADTLLVRKIRIYIKFPSDGFLFLSVL